jgi:DNA-binding CsgD family transcriptional regulator
MGSEAADVPVGRDRELAAARDWSAWIGDGPAALLIRGEAGIGKTVVWSAAAAFAADRGALVLRSRAVEAELTLAYSALGDLLLPVLSRLAGIVPLPQRSALESAIGLQGGDAVDPLLVNRATVAALRGLASNGTVVVAVDDAQWLDPASARAIAFAIRRLTTESIGVLVSVRDPHDDPLDLAGAFGDRLVRLHLDGLSFGPLGHVVRSRIDAGLPRRTLTAIHARSGGNPFYALELARAGGATDELPPTLRDLVRRRLASLDEAPRAAIEEIAVLGPTAAARVSSPTAVDAGVRAGILTERDGLIAFTHPLLSAGAYEQIPPARRRDLHRRAAEHAASLEDRARHLALATIGPNEAVAATLEAAARQAAERGAPELAVELADRARAVTPPDDRAAAARRAMDQADYLAQSADESASRDLVDEIIASGVRGAVRCRALARRALSASRPGDAVAALEEAAAEPHDDRALAVRTLAQLAWQRGAWLGDLEPAVREALRAVEDAETLGDPTSLVAALTTAGILHSIAGRGGDRFFRRALAIVEETPTAAGDHTPRLAFAHERFWRGDFAAAESLLGNERRLAEERGDDGLIMRLNLFDAEFAVRRGRWDEAEVLLEEALVDAREYWRLTALVRRGILRGRRGDPRGRDDADELLASEAATGDLLIAAAPEFIHGLLDLAGGSVTAAAERMLPLAALGDSAGSRGAEYAPVIPETIAVLAESGRIDRASELVDGLARRSGLLSPWGDAAVALGRGLLAHAQRQADEALERLGESVAGFAAIDARWELGQALHAQGSVLRRAGRRRDAAASLERAAGIFRELRAAPALARTEDELRRARPRPRSDDRLTDSEVRVAELVATGLTNREVAAQVFTTVTTVEAHLTRIYSKLGIRSRTELARIVAERGALAGAPATGSFG